METSVPKITEASIASPLPAEPLQQFSPLLAILADERSNALVVSGTVDDLRLIKEMVARIATLGRQADGAV